MSKHIVLAETLFVGSALLCFVIVTWYEEYWALQLLALAIEFPVAGFYLQVMKHHIDRDQHNHDHWLDFPSWSDFSVRQLLQDGLMANMVLLVYYGLIAPLMGIMFVVSFAVCLIFSQQHLIEMPVVFTSQVLQIYGGIFQQIPFINHAFDLPVRGAVIVALLLGALPALWLAFFVSPMALARFAHTGKMSEAFNVRIVPMLSWTTCKFAWQSAAIFIVCNALNLMLTVTAPRVIVMFIEPAIEFSTMIVVYQRMAKSYTRKLQVLLHQSIPLFPTPQLPDKESSRKGREEEFDDA